MGCCIAIDPESKGIRLDVINERNQTNLKTFVYNHIIPGTHMVHEVGLFMCF